MIRTHLLTILLVTSKITFSQISILHSTWADDLSEQRLVTENSRLMQENLFLEAEKLADVLINIKPESCNYNYRKGIAVLYGHQNYAVAKSYLSKAINYTSSNYDSYSKNELSAPHDAYYHIAICEHNLGEIDNAQKNFNQFKILSRKESELLSTLDLKFIQLENARSIQSSVIKDPIQLKELNTSFDDYLPIISYDEKRIFFTSRRTSYSEEMSSMYPDNTFSAIYENDSWVIEQYDFGNPLNNESMVYQPYNGRFALYYSDKEGNGNIFIQNISDETISLPTLNTDYWETHCLLSHDRRTLYFVSDMPGGFGGRDIYKCEYRNGTWSEAINLGSGINTKYDEDAPFLSIDGKTLYFSSNGESSIGGFDVFVSKIDSSGNWGLPSNLGMPINSTSDDVFFMTSVDGQKGYFSSNRSGSSGRLDIYFIENLEPSESQIALFKGTIKTKFGQPLPENLQLTFELSCLNCKSNGVNEIVLYPDLRDGVLIETIEPCKSYKVAFMNGKEKFDEIEFSTECGLKFQEITHNFIYDTELGKYVSPVKESKDTLPLFANIRFKVFLDYNRTHVSSEDEELISAMNSVRNQLRNGKDRVQINIFSSASSVPTKKYGNNQNLANERANTLSNLLKDLIENDTELKGKVQVKVVESSVNGPVYSGDSKNKAKYKLYQYLSFETE